ncbi:MAG: CBS domain-containing protein [Candidatus Electronema sp. V4]|uniref:CBS domain-containing protein n=1 Tax=Candidatus Electronema sp. V4 TaxID=3454756 RepID=UPI0040554E96
MLQAKDLMSANVIAVTLDTEIRELAKVLAANRISGAPVLDGAGRVIGVVTESDLIFQNKKVHIPTAFAILDSFIFLEDPEKMEQELMKMAGTKVADICTVNPVTVREDTPVEEIATLMAEKKVHTLPVLDRSGQLVGVIGKADLIRMIAEGK